MEQSNAFPGRIVVRGNKAKRDEKTIRRTDYVLYFKPGIKIVEAKVKGLRKLIDRQTAMRSEAILRQR